MLITHAHTHRERGIQTETESSLSLISRQLDGHVTSALVPGYVMFQKRIQ